MHISQFHRTNPRNLTGGDGYTVDCGMVSLRDAAINGRSVPLVPFADGRVIKRVYFVPSNGDVPTGASLIIGTPNTLGGNFFNYSSPAGLAFVPDGDLASALDSEGLRAGNSYAVGLTGILGSGVLIADCGPLIALPVFQSGDNSPLGAWHANTAYAGIDFIIAGEGIWQAGGGEGGETDSEEPDFDPNNSPITDGSVTWVYQVAIPTGEVHALAEVIEGVTPMPSYPAAIEFVSPPVDTVAGEIIPDITVIVKDQNGNPYKFGVIEIHLDMMGAGVLSGASGGFDTDPTTGIATFSGCSIADPGTYVIRAQSVPLLVADPIFSDPFDITSP